MLDPEAESIGPEAQAALPPAGPAGDAPASPASPADPPGSQAYLPLAAYSVVVRPVAPPASTWTRTYEVPTARRVVSTGLQLAVEANHQIRRASIYIGLLALGAFGPAVMLLLVGIARLMSDPAIAESIANDPSLVFLEQPEIVGPLLLIYALLAVGIVLLVAISIDAQAMAIAILGGSRIIKKKKLWESIIRARQVFWRLAGAGLLVGLASAVVAGIVVLPFVRPFDSNTGLSFIGSMAGALVVTPFAFTSTGIVLGDVGAIEALRRSMALFRARPRISLVVTLFTLVTSAIQTFAISSGADAAVRVGEVLHLDLEQGGLPLTITTIIVLAFIVAFGSLTFTIAAIVAAPQVTGFLGLTYYSGGLDKARTPDGRRPRRFRWVSLPMTITMIGLLVIAGLGLPSVSGFQARTAGPLLSFLRDAAKSHNESVNAFGGATFVDDPTGDEIGDRNDSFDIVSVDYGFLPEVPDWLLTGSFRCTAANVACGNPSPQPGAFDEGAYVFLLRMAGPAGVVHDYEQGDWGPVLALSRYETAPADTNLPFGSASHAILTRINGDRRTMVYLAFEKGSFAEYETAARSTWRGNDLITIIPVIDDIQSDPTHWDAYAALSQMGRTFSRDSIRPSVTGAGMRAFEFPPDYWFIPLDPFAS